MLGSKTGIICTIGPATFGKVAELREAGMGIARLNFAYAKPEQLELLKEVPVMVDVRKPEHLESIPEKYSYAAVSFVSSSDDLASARDFTGAKIVAKIETKEAMLNLDEIVRNADMVMVARGDLGKNLGIESIGVAQKKILMMCKIHGVPAIVATGLLESMIEQPEARRAEASDITHAIADGASYLLLANETAVGKYPVEATRFMRKVICQSLLTQKTLLS